METAESVKVGLSPYRQPNQRDKIHIGSFQIDCDLPSTRSHLQFTSVSFVWCLLTEDWRTDSLTE